ARSFTFTATTSAPTITFRDTSSATFAVDPLLDNVSVVPTQSCVQPPSGLVGWWKGNGNAIDAVGTNSGTLLGNATFVPGMIGQAFGLDGYHDGVRVGNPAALRLQTFTIETWIRRSNAA